MEKFWFQSSWNVMKMEETDMYIQSMQKYSYRCDIWHIFT